VCVCVELFSQSPLAFSQVTGGGPGGGGSGEPGGGSGGGGGTGGGGGANGNFTHNDQLLIAYFGYDEGPDDYTQLVPPTWESWQDFELNRGPSDPPWTATERMFGAFVVANQNDSDSDGVRDHIDPAIPTNGRPGKSAEPDLIKLIIHIPEWQPHYECNVFARRHDFNNNSTVATEAVRFFGSKSKGSLHGIAGITPWIGAPPVDPFFSGFAPTLGFRITAAGTYTVYAEVNTKSVHICDYEILVEFRKPTNSTANGEYDRVNVTGIWAELPENGLVTERTLFEIKAKGTNLSHQYYFDLWQNGLPPNYEFPVGEGLPETGTIVTIYDDHFVEGQGIYTAPRFESGNKRHARVWLQMRVKAVSADNIGRFLWLEVVNSANKGSAAFIDVGDKIGYSLSPYVHSQVLLKLSDELAGQISADRYAPSWRPGAELTFVVQPKEVAHRLMSNNIRANFDISRQKHYRQYIPNSHELYPTTDELPNDDISGNDEDCSQLPIQEGRLIALDCPGHGNMDVGLSQFLTFWRSHDANTYRIRSEFKEFVRVDLTGKPRPMGADGMEIWGSRCSDKATCFMNSSIQSDQSRPVSFNTFYVFPVEEHSIGQGPNTTPW
jgi:hypothetical protein